MKKRIGSLVLTLCMVLALIPAAAIPVRADVSYEDFSGTWAELKTKMAAGGNIKLTANVTAGSGDEALEVPSGKTVILDLNGHTIDRGLSGKNLPQTGGSVIVIANGGNLTLNDSVGTGKLTGGAAGNGGGVCIGSDSSGSQARFTMNGGTITGNTVFATSNTTGRGGGVYSTSSGNGGVFTMTGGAITGNTTKYTETNYANYSAQAVGGGVYSGGVFWVYDSARIVENHAISKGTGSSDPEITRTENVYLPSSNDGGKKISVQGTLGTDALIGVTIAGGEKRVFTTSGSRDRNDPTKFFSDNSKYAIIQNSDRDLAMVDSPTVSTWSELRDKLAEGGTVMLGGDVTYGTGGGTNESTALSVPSGKSVTLDLNGYTINRNLSSATSNGYVIKVSGSLTLNDSSAAKTGTITGGYNSSSGSGGGVFVDGDGNNKQGVFTMNGGTITGGKASSGGGVYIDHGTLTMNGGNITGNTATSSSTANSGGGGVFNSFGTLTMTGGSITNNITNGTEGGGVYLNGSSAKLNLSGAVNISNNYKGGSLSGSTASGGTANNVYLNAADDSTNKTIRNNMAIVIAGTLASDARIGVSPASAFMAYDVPFSKTGTNAAALNDLSKFESDNSDYVITQNASGQLVMSKLVGDWATLSAELTKGTEAYPHHITLSGDVTAASSEERLQVGSDGTGANAVLDLAGNTIDRGLSGSTAVSNGEVLQIYSNSVLTLRDSSENKDGKITGGNTTGSGGGVYMSSSATFNMEGGTISGNTATSGGGIYMAGGTFTMSGGTIARNSTTGTDSGTGNGGGVNAFNGTFTMSGGEISNNTASRYGGGAEVKTFTMSGGTISNNTATDGDGGGVFVDTGGTLKLSGNPTISGNKKGDADNNVGLLGGTKITVTDTLTYSTPIGVTMKTPGVFTSGLSGKGGIGKFSSDSESYTVVEDNGEAKLAAQYTVTYNANGGTGTMAAGTAISGVAFTLPANSFTAPTGKQFKAWSIGGTEYAAGSTYTFTDSTTVTALWEDIPASSYTISVAGGISNGTVASDKTSAAEGETVTLTATPSSGYAFDSWSVTKAGGGSVTVTDNKFTMPASNVTVSATFEAVAPSTHSVTITPDAHMTASSGSGSQTVDAGSAMTNVVYTANTGYFFPDSYSVSAVSGVTVTRNSVSQITVSGTPTGDVSLSLTAPTQLNAISVSSSAHKTTYTVGDNLNVSGLVIALNDPAAATVNVTAGMVSGFNSSTAGTKTLTITYGGKTTTYTVTINNAATPSRPSYSGGDNSSSTPATVTVPVSGDANTVNVTVTISDTTATLRSADIKSALADNKETGTVEIDVGGLDRDINAITIPAGMVSDIAAAVTSEDNATDSLTVKLTDGTVTFDAAAVEAITAQAGGNDLQLNLDGVQTDTMNTAQQSAVSEIEVVGVLDVYMTSGSTRISDFKGGSAEVRIPFTAPTGRTAAEYRVWYVAENGALTNQRARYDTADTCFVFTVTHFSNYIIAYSGDCPQDETCPISAFTDADPKAWYHDGVHYVLGNGIMSGCGKGLFGPSNNTSRATMAQILWNMEGKPVVNYTLSFTDVKADKWYDKAIRWATAEDIMNGYGGGLFGPDDAMTREQLAAIVHRYAKYKGMDVSATSDLLGYTDADKVSGWAMASMKWAVSTGIIHGKGNGILDPKGIATRAEIAQIVMNYDLLGE